MSNWIQSSLLHFGWNLCTWHVFEGQQSIMYPLSCLSDNGLGLFAGDMYMSITTAKKRYHCEEKTTLRSRERKGVDGWLLNSTQHNFPHTSMIYKNWFFKWAIYDSLCPRGIKQKKKQKKDIDQNQKKWFPWRALMSVRSVDNGNYTSACSLLELRKRKLGQVNKI